MYLLCYFLFFSFLVLTHKFNTSNASSPKLSGKSLASIEHYVDIIKRKTMCPHNSKKTSESREKSST